MDVQGAVYANGTPVQIYDCNGTPAQKWVIDHGQTKVRVAGTNFCLDRGETPGNGIGMKIWQCYENQPDQTWEYNASNQIGWDGTCVDLTNGVTTNGNQLQTWECATGNNNQVWAV
ncbi:carbohydrate-binding module family 13 protein [Crepidotus variabilis]|uniref:Carbohydrate-binding module family 13 protein n=1 Tax=Crepidotus variabilis TaxID=179855 RepID=A0A9P6JSD3_9AGAR|nr:carbohydrate-binding module family 13 protein [Crepidotus variabilis]